MFAELLTQQQGLCAICSVELDGSRKSLKPHVDHNHRTGEVRGLLCGYCNVALGNFQDDASLLIEAIDYLLKGRGDV